MTDSLTSNPLSLLREVGKHIEERSLELPPELALRVLNWYRATSDETSGDLRGVIESVVEEIMECDRCSPQGARAFTITRKGYEMLLASIDLL